MFSSLRIIPVFGLTLLAVMPSNGWGQPAQKDETAALDFFEKRIRPLLAENCYNCHSADTNSKGGLRVDDRNGLLNGGNRGPAVVPGHPEKSLLIQAVRQKEKGPKMPPMKQLSDEQIADLTRWVAEGAAWPKVRVPASVGKANPEYDRLRKEHWAWQPLKEAKVPAVKDATWGRDELDRFILATLEAKGLQPVGDADRVTLLRRVTFDLTGLPPTAEQVEKARNDKQDKWLETLVDELLASPAFGERWGRHWLDIARYGESTGSARNLPYPQAWRYRDYVLDSFNKDKPYNRFILEQIAGDLLPSESPKQRDEQLIATGFLALGVKDVNQRFKVRFIMDNIDEQIDTVTRSVLGLTASCARCHDHKFDPIPQADYYALAGIFHSTDLCAGLRNKMGGGGLDYYDPSLLLRIGGESTPVAPKVPAAKIAQAKKAYEDAKAAFEKIKGTPEGLKPGANGKPVQQPLRLKMVRLEKEYQDLTNPAGQVQTAMGVRDAKTIGDTELRVRGEAEKLGPVIPRGFLTVVNVPGATKINPAQSGRLELAQWLTSEKNPLTSRVLVNRVWHYLFGTGLVSSVDNFGSTGDTPSHPELLDHLAARFVREGWSIKKLVRAVVLSRAYQLGSDAPKANRELDPANRLVWRHSPRRLSAEEMRDAVLVAAGTLDRTRPQGSLGQDFKVIELRNNGPEARKLGEQANALRHRSVYLPLLRGMTPSTIEAFDAVEQGMVTGNRDATTVAPQALFLLNDPFIRRQSLTLADRLLAQKDLEDTARIDAAYRHTLGRSATSKEIERAKVYLSEYELAARDLVKVGPVKPNTTTTQKPETTKTTPANPDEIDQTDTPIGEEEIRPASLKAAAWGSFCQALIGSAEFRYLR